MQTINLTRHKRAPPTKHLATSPIRPRNSQNSFNVLFEVVWTMYVYRNDEAALGKSAPRLNRLAGPNVLTPRLVLRTPKTTETVLDELKGMCVDVLCLVCSEALSDMHATNLSLVMHLHFSLLPYSQGRSKYFIVIVLHNCEVSL